MQTSFSLAQLADPDIREADAILRKCVHCGFCTATCPTYLLLGDELDSPRGRIYLIKDMLESGRPPTAKVVRHIDRCLSCLSCMTTCPSGVHYMHLVDHARRHIEHAFRRPLGDRLLRRLLALVLVRPRLLRLAFLAAGLARPLAGLLPGRLKAVVAMAPRRQPGPDARPLRPQVFPAQGARRARVALLAGCVQQAMAPAINAATVRLLTRLGCEVVVAEGAGCCGALDHHLGREAAALAAVRANVEAWGRALEGGGLDAVIANASGCGTMLKDYGFVLRGDAACAEKAARIADLAVDVSEFLDRLDAIPPAAPSGLRVAYQAPCSLQHGQGVSRQPRALLTAAGYEVLEVPEGHLCCGSAGTYNLLQPTLAARLRARKVAAIDGLAADLVATGNIGCMVQIASGTALPVVHTVELLDWATGGPRPAALAAAGQDRSP